MPLSKKKLQEPSPQTIDTGRVYFFYRPRVQASKAQSFEDVQRLVVILSSQQDKLYRSLVVGHKRLPDPAAAGREKFWGFVQSVGTDPEQVRVFLSEERYETKTRGKRRQPAARPAGEGAYAFVKHGQHTHLVYVLRFPKQPGEVQRALNIRSEASYIVAIKDANLPWWSEPMRFVPMKNPSELAEGAEIVIISASADVSSELGLNFDLNEDAFDEVRLFDDLRVHEDDHPINPLISGTWA
jgi:hypothetical protein